MEVAVEEKTIAAVYCDLEHSPLGGRSRLREAFAGRCVLAHTLGALSRVEGLGATVLLTPSQQTSELQSLVDGMRLSAVDIMPVAPRDEQYMRTRQAARAWNVSGWRGGAGQWTVFDEDYHPQGVHQALRKWQATNALCVPAHAALADAALLTNLVQHHLHKNHSFRLSFLPAVPGLAAIVLRAELAEQMASAGWSPGQVLAYQPAQPAFDMLGQDASMPADPLLCRLPHRLLLDTQRGMAMATLAMERSALAVGRASAAEWAAAYAALDEPEAFGFPRALEMQPTAARLSQPPGAMPASLRCTSTLQQADAWRQFFGRQALPDDLTVTFGGDGDPLLYPHIGELAAAARAAGAVAIQVQTDLLENVALLDAMLAAGTVDTVTVRFYGNDAATYKSVCGHDGFATATANMERLLSARHNGLPLVLPRLLKVRETVGQMEAFFETHTTRLGWACFDYPTDRAGQLPFAGVADMANPRRARCRRLWSKLVIGSDGQALACNEDLARRWNADGVGSTVSTAWRAAPLVRLRTLHAAGQWQQADPCGSCREWHRA